MVLLPVCQLMPDLKILFIPFLMWILLVSDPSAQ